MKYLVTYQASEEYIVQEDEVEASRVEIKQDIGVFFWQRIEGKIEGKGDKILAFYKMKSFIKFTIVEETANGN